VGLLVDLELAAARAAVRGFARMPRSAYLSINLSPVTAISPRLGSALRGAPTDRIVVEITEHARVDDYDALAAGLAGLRADGGRLAIDDAGAGFASLRHILLLSPDMIKLDVSLTRDIDRDRARRAMAAALISFADEMGLTIVAEGIETPRELKTLRALGVRMGQGYYLARPSADFGEPPSAVRSGAA
jgi:EAL domain-containing protein (putative c-di-GMP-specific phosphodiesterase class I)